MMEPRSLSLYAFKPVSSTGDPYLAVPCAFLYGHARADSAFQPDSSRMETRSASCPQGSGFQQLREAVSETNPRKRAYRYDHTTAQVPANDEREVAQTDCDYSKDNGFSSSSKRSRVTDWPLKNTTQSSLSGRASPSTAQGKRTSSRGRSGKKKVTNRLSKFQEGSLNDKPSKKPPHTFLGVEDAMEQYHWEGADKENDHVTNDAGIEGTRLSNAFRFGRFGKAVANVFNGFWKEKEPPIPPPKRTSVDDRKVKGESAYASLKRNGFKGTCPSHTPLEDQETEHKKIVDSQTIHGSSFRDSAIDVDEFKQAPLQTIHTLNTSETLKPPSNMGPQRSASPASDLRSERRSSSLHLRTPSFQSLKKVESQIHTPSIMRSTEVILPLPIGHDQLGNRPASQGLRRQSSKKDLAKHQRLSKKVSDLESKLDIARRELEKSLQEVPPVPDVPAYLGRKPFTPGALASLPSERFLTPQTSATPVAYSNMETYDSTAVSSTSALLSSPSRQLAHELSKSINEDAVINSKEIESLMSSDPIARPDIDGVDYASWAAAQAAKNRRKSTRRTSGQHLSIDGKVDTSIKKRQSSASAVFKAPKASPPHDEEAAPQIPAISITTNNANRPRPESPFLGRPGAASPVRTRSKSKKREVSPPPSILSSASKKKTRFTSFDYENDTALTPDHAVGNCQKKSAAKGSPAPKAVQLKAARAKAVKVKVSAQKRTDKPLPEIQSREENFEWDEDVF